MKKKVCALLLAAVLTIGMSVTVLADRGWPIPGGGNRPESINPCPATHVAEAE